MHLPGVIPGFNLALPRRCRAGRRRCCSRRRCTRRILRAPDNCGLDARRGSARAARRTGATRSTSTRSARPSASGRASSSCATRTTRSAACGRGRTRAHGRDLPRAEPHDRLRRDPLRPRLPGTPARADRLARSGDRAAHDHAHGAEQDLQPPRPQVLDRDHPERARSARSFVAAQLDLVQGGERPRLRGDAGRLPRRAALARRVCLHYLEANRDFVAEYVATKLPGITMAQARGQRICLARLPRGRTSRRTIPSRSSSSGRRWRSTTAPRSATRAKASPA